ncbi:PTS transporter subunit EIIC [Mycoplasma tullyi]|uniref:PTS transporter subunit EIIC n=1 Tax=Mycoplasma tullyi TaxID=1612150 RepID=A0A7D7U8J6_9MOLU|nr:glucose PTS transporter subunit IIA [Mycoplasma tullyi]QMT98643.1 PTS transporter subunit EIIC [Mycoplasma tullyi]
MASTTNQVQGQKHSSERWKKFSGHFKEVVGKLSAGIMIPIALLPIAGLLLGIFAAVQNNISQTAQPGVYAMAAFFKNGADAIFGNLPVLFAVAIAVAFTNQSGIAALAALVGWIVFNATQSALIFQIPNTETFRILYYPALPKTVLATNVGIQSLSTSVFGGVIVGAISAVLFNKFHTIQLPKVIGFFNGNRFVPIITLLTMLPLALVTLMIWPGVGLGLNALGENLGFLARNSNFNSFIFGYVERALVPFGLHHAFYTPLWFTSAGGTIANIVTDQAGQGAIAPLIVVDENGQKVVRSIIGIAASKDAMKPAGFQAQNWMFWGQVVKALNPGQTISTESLSGDQRLWFTINSLFVNKSVYLSGAELPYTFTFKSFADSTLNHPALIQSITRNGATISGANLLAMVNSSTTGGIDLQPTDVLNYAFPGVNPGQYEQGKYAFMIFGLPAAGAAMIMAAPKDQRKYAASIIISAAFTSFLTGITEPIEFTFLFLAPYLFWGFHAFFCAVSFWLTSLLGGNIGQTFSGGIIDLTIYGFVPDALGAKTNSWLPLVIGLFYIPLYYFTFYFVITKRNIETPGRGAGMKLYTKADYQAKVANKDAGSAKDGSSNFKPIEITSYKLMKAFGGRDNITAVNACATKLRVSVKTKEKVSFGEIGALGSLGTYAVSDTLVHAVYGGDADIIKSYMQKMVKDDYDASAIEKAAGGAPAKEAEKPVGDAPAKGTDKPAADPATKEIDPSMPKATPEVDHKLSDVIEVFSPVKGTVRDLADLPDPSFAGKIMGDGVSIDPEDGMFYAPVEGKLELAYNTGHAYFFDANGAKILIHIGIDTVSLNSDNSDTNNLVGFKMFAKSGDNVSLKKSPVVQANLEMIKMKELSTSSPILALTETLANYDLKVVVKPGDKVNVGDLLFKLIKKNK